MDRIRAHQHAPFGDIRIFARTPQIEAVEAEGAADVAAP